MEKGKLLAPLESETRAIQHGASRRTAFVVLPVGSLRALGLCKDHINFKYKIQD